MGRRRNRSASRRRNASSLANRMVLKASLSSFDPPTCFSLTQVHRQSEIVVTAGESDLKAALSSSCQSLTIFKRFGPAPTNLETNDTIGRTFTTLFMTLTGLLAFISLHSCGQGEITSATGISRRRHRVDLDDVARALPVICPTQG